MALTGLTDASRVPPSVILSPAPAQSQPDAAAPRGPFGKDRVDE
jgi:hypothetical protein